MPELLNDQVYSTLVIKPDELRDIVVTQINKSHNVVEQVLPRFVNVSHADFVDGELRVRCYVDYSDIRRTSPSEVGDDSEY
jgi:hypothetical protein